MDLFSEEATRESCLHSEKKKIVKNPFSDVPEFPSFDKIEHGGLLSLSLSTNTTMYTHGLHRFPAKYIPQVPRWALDNFTDSDSIILDPFMGSGTTLVEGLCRVRESFGVDIDPLARLITNAKISFYDIQRINQLADQLLAVSGLLSGKLHYPDELPMRGVKNVFHWFRPEAFRDLSAILDSIQRINCTDQERDFFLCIFSASLRWVSNADDQSQKTYVSGTLKKTPPEVIPTFKKFLYRAMKSIGELKKNRGSNRATVLPGDALSLPIDKEYVDLIVTSPPYLDSIDYMYNFMLEYFWLGPHLGVFDRQEFNKRRRQSVGSKNPLNKEKKLPKELNDSIFLDKVPDYRRSALVSYFNLMKEHFSEAERVLKKNGRYVLVVGNSQSIHGAIPVHDCLLKLAKSCGLHLEKAFAYRIRRHYMKFPRKGRGGIILMDWVITLKKTDDRILENEERLPLPDFTIGHDEVAN